jgi:hypothetical protein
VCSSNAVSSVLTGLSATFFLPWIVSLSMASPDPQAGSSHYRKKSPPPAVPAVPAVPAAPTVHKPGLQELYLWKTVDFIYPNEAR